MKSVSLFSPKIEKINLFFPIPFIIISLIEAFKFTSFRDQNFRDTFSYISLIIFLNYLHVFFTPFFLTVLPGGRKWFIEKCKLDKSHRWIFLVLVIASYRYFIYPAHQPTLYFDLLFSGFLELFAIYHNASQTYGLSLLYNKKSIEQGRITKEQISKSEKIERMVFYIQFSLITFASIGRRTPLGEGVVRFIMPISLIISFLYLLMIYFQTKSIVSNKLIYSLRFLLYPLTLNSFIATMGILSFHGIEYLFVTHKLIEKDGGDYRLAGIVFMFLLIFIAIVYSYTYFLSDKSIYWFPFQYLNSFFSIFILIHYWLDGLLFKSKDKISRQYIFQNLISSN